MPFVRGFGRNIVDLSLAALNAFDLDLEARDAGGQNLTFAPATFDSERMVVFPESSIGVPEGDGNGSGVEMGHRKDPLKRRSTLELVHLSK